MEEMDLPLLSTETPPMSQRSVETASSLAMEEYPIVSPSSLIRGQTLIPNTAMMYSRTTSRYMQEAHSCHVADGKVHEAKIQYLPYVETRYFELMTANENLVPYLKDNGEGRRLGTLAVFVDRGIIEDRPLLAIPINLSLALHLSDSLAYVGFTASTGRKWEIHDILNWSFEETD